MVLYRLRVLTFPIFLVCCSSERPDFQTANGTPTSTTGESGFTGGNTNDGGLVAPSEPEPPAPSSTWAATSSAASFSTSTSSDSSDAVSPASVTPQPEACSPGQTRCESECVNTQSSTEHCGQCDMRCDADEVCSLGVCQTSCDNPLFECNGSCVNIDTDLSNCGECELACPTPTGGTATCQAGMCGITCDGTTACGSECVDTETSPDHCGECTHGCEDDEVCDQGNCTQDCTSPLQACDGACVNLDVDAKHCGECETSCSVPPGGMATCEDGKCGIACDGTMACGDECVDTETSAAHCGGCDQACKAGEVCNAGACQKACTSPHIACNDSCINVNTDPANCGQCGNACARPTGSTATCSGGTCGFSCDGGLTKCGNECVDLQTANGHCGTCETECGNGEACEAGVCVCSPGSHACDDGAACYANNDADHCGDDCHECSEFHGTTDSCTNDTCACIDAVLPCSSDTPSCGTWDFNDGTLQGLRLHEDSPAGVGAPQLITVAGSPAAVVTYPASTTSWIYFEVELCPNAALVDLSAFELSYDVRVTSERQSGTASLVAFRDRLVYTACQSSVETGTTMTTRTCVPNSSQGATTLQIAVAPPDNAGGTVAIDNIRLRD